VFFSSQSKQKGETISPSQTNEGTTVTEETIVTEESETNTSTELALGGSYKCTYTMEQGLKVTTYVKNGKMRTEIPLEVGDTNISLYTDNKVYQWSTKEKQGFFMSVEEAKSSPIPRFKILINILRKLGVNINQIAKIWICLIVCLECLQISNFRIYLNC